MYFDNNMTDFAHITTMNLSAAVDAELDAVARDHPSGKVTQVSVRKRLNAYRAVLRRFIQVINHIHDHKESGIVVARMISDVIDRFVVHAHGLIFCGENRETGLTIAALGGYGRQELNPFSDIDILCLVKGNGTGDSGSHISAIKISDMLQFLWDMNLDLGHSTRTVEQCIEAASSDAYFATSLLDVRFITGSQDIWGELEERFSGWLRESTGKKLLKQKIDERNLRLNAYHGTVQIQAPNVKECPGTLRDIHVSRWLIKLTSRGSNINDLYTTGIFSKKEASDYESDLNFLLSMRHSLHFLAGKRTDILDHTILPEIAKKLGYTGSGISPVEKMMHDYYMRAGRVRRLTDRIIKKVLEECDIAVSQHFRPTPEGILIGEKDVHIPQEKAWIISEQPHILISLFAIAGSHELSLSVDTTSIIEKSLDVLPVNFPELPEVRTAFHDLLNMHKGTAHALRLMYEYGLLIKLIPEFDQISWHYQYDFYHTFTTDEHSIRVVENLEHMATAESPVVPDLSDIMEEVTAKGALYLAGLLHDIGKSGGRGHAHRGELMAAQALRRLGYDNRTIDLVRFLIREHLLMSHISQRRDMDDEGTIADFVERVGSTGRLRMLTLLTFADLMALSEGALTEWKKALLRGLYNRGLMLIEKGYEQHIISLRKHGINTIVKALSKDIPGKIVRNHLQMLPEQYIRITGRASIRAHIRGVEFMKRKGAWASFAHRGDVNLLTVIAPDYPKALSDICGTITSSDINILGARIFTRNDGIIIDTFLVMSSGGDELIPLVSQRTFKQNIVRVIRKEADVKDLIDEYHRRWRRRKKKVVFAAPRVRIHNDISAEFTVIDVFATDYTGLLYDITSILASLNIDIHTARIGTDEDQVADAFYIRNRAGGKIEDEMTIKNLSDAIIRKLNEAYE